VRGRPPEDSNDDVNPRGLPYYLSKLVPSTGSGYDSTIDVAGTFAGRRVLYGDGTDPRGQVGDQPDHERQLA
jgi:hypothetical protein